MTPGVSVHGSVLLSGASSRKFLQTLLFLSWNLIFKPVFPLQSVDVTSVHHLLALLFVCHGHLMLTATCEPSLPKG